MKIVCLLQKSSQEFTVTNPFPHLYLLTQELNLTQFVARQNYTVSVFSVKNMFTSDCEMIGF
jgi:hypothetical protein